MASPTILLPPSEGKAPGGGGPPWTAGSMALDLDEQRGEVIRALTRAMRSNATARSALLGVKGDALRAATAADRSVRTAPTMAAIERYTGVLYRELDPGALPAAARARLDRSVLIVSGLWGLVAPTDMIPQYKLKMGAALPPMGRLSTWWRPALSRVLAERVGSSVVWDLLPEEHAAALHLPAGSPRVTVRFLEPGRDGRLVAVSHWNKLLKGALVDRLVRRPVRDPLELEDWEHPRGHRLDPSLTERDGDHLRLSFVLAD